MIKVITTQIYKANVEGNVRQGRYIAARLRMFLKESR